MIEVIVNGEKRTVSSQMNVNNLIEELKYKQKWFAFALNGTFVALDSYESTMIKNNDKVEILAPVQGG
ncbi:MAG: thiamine biosynthesis protein ThiS [Arcobacter sp.]|nr:thiamine biosynthesis protein ThiS [Arcobacter sp.]|tara:strand:- start:6970 stop:7173 length:204 start_codon:yes stop_codon:yes gene_type:complete